jgi:ribosomal protein S10
MIARIGGTVVDGMLELDEPVPLPPNTRVTITIEPVSESDQRQAAWERFHRRIRERPLHLGVRDWTREGLYERD